MCKDGKCHERAGQARSAIISLGAAAREMSRLADHPHMVVRAHTYIAFVLSDPELTTVPGITVIMEVYSTTTDAEVAQKADSYLENARRPPPALIRMLEQLFGLAPAPGAPGGLVDDEPRATFETSARISAETLANDF